MESIVIRPWLPSPLRTASGLKSGPKKVFPTVVVANAVVVVFLAPPPPGVLLGVSASEPRLSSTVVVVTGAAAAAAADSGAVAGEAEVAESRPPFLFFR